MTAFILKHLAAETVSLDREINEKTGRLKEIKAGLVAEPRSRKGELTPTDGGTRWTAEGGGCCIARFNFPEPTLKAKADGNPLLIPESDPDHEIQPT